MQQNDKITWTLLEPEVREAISKQTPLNEFLQMRDITRDKWHRIKPKGFPVTIKRGIYLLLFVVFYLELFFL